MSLSPDTSQGVADALEYLQHHLHELTERQNISENNINTALITLTAQLQQLTQLVANPPTCTNSFSGSTPCSDGKIDAERGKREFSCD